MFREVALVSQPPNTSDLERNSCGLGSRLIGVVSCWGVNDGNEEGPCRVSKARSPLPRDRRDAKGADATARARVSPPLAIIQETRYHKTAPGEGGIG